MKKKKEKKKKENKQKESEKKKMKRESEGKKETKMGKRDSEGNEGYLEISLPSLTKFPNDATRLTCFLPSGPVPPLCIDF